MRFVQVGKVIVNPEPETLLNTPPNTTLLPQYGIYSLPVKALVKVTAAIL